MRRVRAMLHMHMSTCKHRRCQVTWVCGKLFEICFISITMYCLGGNRKRDPQTAEERDREQQATHSSKRRTKSSKHTRARQTRQKRNRQNPKARFPYISSLKAGPRHELMRPNRNLLEGIPAVHPTTKKTPARRTGHVYISRADH